MHVSAATILAIYVAVSNALPSPRLNRFPAIDESIPGCKEVGTNWPPSPAELRCRGITVDDENLKKKHVQIEKRKLPEINRSLPGCKNLKAGFPPSQQELYCRGLADKNGKKISKSKGGKRDASPAKSSWREYAESMIDHSIPGCTDVAWLDVMPKSAEQIHCEKLIAEAREKKQKQAHVEVEKRGLPDIIRSLPGCKELKASSPPSRQELYCRGLLDAARGKKMIKSNGKRDALPPLTPWGVYEDMMYNHNSKRDALPAENEKWMPKTWGTPRGCENMAFLAVSPPSKAELGCKGLLNDEGDPDWEKILGQYFDEIPDRTHVQIDKRAPSKIDQTIPGCRNRAFTAVIPPSKAELKCLGLIDDEGNPVWDKILINKGLREELRTLPLLD